MGKKYQSVSDGNPSLDYQFCSLSSFFLSAYSLGVIPCFSLNRRRKVYSLLYPTIFATLIWECFPLSSSSMAFSNRNQLTQSGKHVPISSFRYVLRYVRFVPIWRANSSMWRSGLRQNLLFSAFFNTRAKFVGLGFLIMTKMCTDIMTEFSVCNDIFVQRQ